MQESDNPAAAATGSSWNGIDLLVILFLYFLLPSCCVQFGNATHPLPPETTQIQPIESAPPHPVVTIMEQARDNPLLLLSLFLIVVVLTPVNEEFFFRLLLLGYLRDLESRGRRLLGRHENSPGLLALLFVSLLFAAAHSRDPESTIPAETLCRTLFWGTLGLTLASLSAVLWLVVVRRLRWRHFGIDLGLLRQDMFLGIIAFVVAFPILTLLNQLLATLFPGIVPDPAPIFFFALLLGWLFLHTGRITASLTAHAAFNAASLVLAALVY